jgi:hypothetical protein
MFIVYNLRRIMNILNRDWLREYLKLILSKLSGHFGLVRSRIRRFNRGLYPILLFCMPNQFKLRYA